jgi:gluconolactonase
MVVGNRLLACEMDGQLKEYNPETGEQKSLAKTYKGVRFNAPNDLVIDNTGGIYFTDPRYRAPEPWPQGTEAVYYRAADGKVTRLIDDRTAPNGVILSPDEKTLYVIPSMEKQMWAYPVLSPGKIGQGTVFCEVTQPDGAKTPAGGDGLTIDTQGNLYITTALGLQVFDPSGKQLGIIAIPEHPANVTFGGKDNKTLFVTARKSLYSVETEATGHVFPGPK